MNNDGISRKIGDLKEDSSKAVNKVSRQITYLKEDSSRSVSSFFYNLWKSTGNIGIGFLNVFPMAGKAVYTFLGNTLTNIFHGIYAQQVGKGKAGKIIMPEPARGVDRRRGA